MTQDEHDFESLLLPLRQEQNKRIDIELELSQTKFMISVLEDRLNYILRHGKSEAPR